ncbi:MAG: GNAT family N-acetyltransferase [Leptolyngbya sp. SIOISBB]|nr:GNAT family N-acetyltransferase [Leptolyngbya sp. SIOISBB]
MATRQRLSINYPSYGIKGLSPDDAAQLQTLFDQCADFFIMTNGALAEATAAAAEFTDVPEGKTSEDVLAWGLVDDRDRLVGTIIGVQGYPDSQTWWVGLMLLAPEQRGQGLGVSFYQAFEQWVAHQGYRFISLCAIAPNTVGRRFWQQLGFEEIRQFPARLYGTQTHDVHVYQRRL